jgi:hypothetical protein
MDYMESPVISNLPIGGTLRSHRKLRILERYSEARFPEEVNMELTNELVYIVDDEEEVGEALSTFERFNCAAQN